MNDNFKPGIIGPGPGHTVDRQIHNLAALLAMSSIHSPPLTADYEISMVPTISHDMLEYPRFLPDQPGKRAPLSPKERARRKNRNQMAKESRKKNRKN
jgi:hypothetical protein